MVLLSVTVSDGYNVACWRNNQKGWQSSHVDVLLVGYITRTCLTSAVLAVRLVSNVDKEVFFHVKHLMISS
jgi:hypothetical protein